MLHFIKKLVDCLIDEDLSGTWFVAGIVADSSTSGSFSLKSKTVSGRYGGFIPLKIITIDPYIWKIF